MANIRKDELEAFRELANVILGYNETEMNQRVRDGALIVVRAPQEEDED